MKRYIALLIVLALGVGFFMSRQTFRPQTVVKQQLTEEQILKLPSDWKKIDDKDVNLKFEKQVGAGIKPQIVFKDFQSTEASAPAKYTDTLIAGAKSTIPSLKVLDDMRNSTEKFYSAFIRASYTNKGQKIKLIQRVYIIKDQVKVLTASFTGDLDAEINQILDNLVAEKIKL